MWAASNQNRRQQKCFKTSASKLTGKIILLKLNVDVMAVLEMALKRKSCQSEEFDSAQYRDYWRDLLNVALNQMLVNC